MSPYPIDRAVAVGPMRLVLTAFPEPGPAAALIRKALRARLAACASATSVVSRYWWKGSVEEARETLVLFKTSPKHVGALFRFLERAHPYDVPEILELDVPRVHRPYLAYLVGELDRYSPPAPLGGGHRARRRVTRPGAPRARAARRPARTRAPPRHRY